MLIHCDVKQITAEVHLSGVQHSRTHVHCFKLCPLHLPPLSFGNTAVLLQVMMEWYVLETTYLPFSLSPCLFFLIRWPNSAASCSLEKEKLHAAWWTTTGLLSLWRAVYSVLPSNKLFIFIACLPICLSFPPFPEPSYFHYSPHAVIT